MAFIAIFNSLLFSEEIIPSESQIQVLRGKMSVSEGIQTTSASQTSDDSHGAVTYYKIPFNEGTFSFSWKVDQKQGVTLILDSKPNGKDTHICKVIMDGTVGKKTKQNVVTMMTYNGSTREKKTAQKKVEPLAFIAGQWNITSITVEGDKATVHINDNSFTMTSELFKRQIMKVGIGTGKGTIFTKDVIVNKMK